MSKIALESDQREFIRTKLERYDCKLVDVTVLNKVRIVWFNDVLTGSTHIAKLWELFGDCVEKKLTVSRSKFFEASAQAYINANEGI